MKSKFHEHEGPWKQSGQNKKILNVLNDLIRINIDRITAYEKASHDEATGNGESSDHNDNVPDENTSGMREIFYRLSTDSRAYVNTLHAEVIKLGGAPVTQSTISGKIHLHWLDGKHNFEGTEVVSRLDACIAAEADVQKAYRQALDEQNHLPERIYQLVENQLWALERAHEQLVSVHQNHGAHENHNSHNSIT